VPLARGCRWTPTIHKKSPLLLKLTEVRKLEFSNTCFPANLPSHGHYTGQPALAGTSSQNWWILSVQSFTACMPFAGGKQRIRIMEKTLEFSSTVLSTLSPYTGA